ncbi:GNAT family N-acetyltransferase [Fibrivirga algicola]|uniref:GNAT family N-acetyltransferase n=1 Tax=Fibrivirga algicola TaxID=2950420 RepID=A0ABX0QH34_9BACT|nr:GNAT family N-acetyltransferase [Fibrivirga algicola]NID11705.1 GNAT family N-acetyltransferase [Fibrivirga algicola]
MKPTRIISYEPHYQASFKQINIDCISDLFTVEPHDLEQLDHPELHILPNDGEILLAQQEETIVGTVALIRTGSDEFELAKMGVARGARGLGIGRLLCEAAVDYARQKGARRVWLESNKKAAAAVQLYESIRFVHIPLRDSPYARADVHMELMLELTTPRQTPVASEPQLN